MKSNIYSDRMQSVFKSCRNVDAILIEKPVDLFYLTGLELSAGTLFISKKGGYLLVDGRYIGFAEKKGVCPCELTSSESFKKMAASFSNLGFDCCATSFARWEELKNLTKKQLIPLKRPTDATRVIKSRAELKALKQSAALLWKGYEYLKKSLKVDITEREIATLFELFCLERGAEKVGFEPIVAFGKNSAFPHYRAGAGRLKKGDVVLLDLGVVVNHYHSDMTRTLFFGRPDPRLVIFEAAVKEAHDAALLQCRPGVKVGELDRISRRVIEKAGLESYLAHTLGHGVGLEIHEFPRLKEKGEDHDVLLQEGMVITIEPGLYWPGVGGIRYEDTIVITRTGYENWYP